MRKVSATPTVGCFVRKKYNSLLKENGYTINSAIKTMSLPSKENTTAMMLLLLCSANSPMTPLNVSQPRSTVVSDLSSAIESPEETGGWTHSDDNQETTTFQDNQINDPLKDLVRDCIVDELMPLVTQTMPFLIDEMIHNNFYYGEVEGGSMSLVRDIHAHQESRLTNMLEGTTKAEARRMQLDNRQENRINYPMLSCYQIPFCDPWVRGNLLIELYNYNLKETGSSTMHFSHGNDVRAALVMILQCSHLDSMKTNDTRHNFVSEILENLSKEGSRPEATCKDFLTMLARSDDCREQFREVAHSEGLSPIERLDEETSFAIQSDSNLSNTQFQALRQNQYFLVSRR
jgi:hypothetical protein